MASTLSSRSLRSSLLSLPPQLRAACYMSARSFSATHVNRTGLIDLAVAGPSFILDSVHSLGIPWHTALPVTAVLVRSTFVYFFSTIPGRRNRELQNQLVPLASAHALLEWNSQAERKRRQDDIRVKELDPRFLELRGVFDRWRFHLKAMRKLRKAYGVNGIRPWGLVNFGILIAFTEAIRLKCGTRDGLLKLVISPFEWLRKQFDTSGSSTSPILGAMDSEEVLAHKLQAARERLLAMAQAKAQNPDIGEATAVYPKEYLNALQQTPQHDTAVNSMPVSSLETTNPYLDPTFQTEGLPWITNLTIADPTFILPLTLLLTMIGNAILRPTSPGAASSQKPRSFIVRKIYDHRWGVAISYLFFFAAMNMPAAILLYFIPSLAAGWMQQRWMDWKHPIQPPIRPCTRPIRVKVKKGW